MQQDTAQQAMRRIIAGGVLAAAISAAAAGNGAGRLPTARRPQLMLYVSQPLWSHGTLPRIFGLRLDEVRWSVSLLPTAVEVYQRRPLINLEMTPYADLRVEFGGRVSWDFAHAPIGLRSDPSGVVIEQSINATRPAPSMQRYAWSLPSSGLTPIGEDLGRDLANRRAGGSPVTALVTFDSPPRALRSVPADSSLGMLLPLAAHVALAPVRFSPVDSSAGRIDVRMFSSEIELQGEVPWRRFALTR